MAASGLIQPVKSGAELVDEIQATRPEPGTLAIWWLGQSGFLIKSSRGMLVVDPYLSEHLTKKYAETDKPHVRMTEAPLRGGDLAEVDLVLVSHRHSDHLDPETLPYILGVSPDADVLLPESIARFAETRGLPGKRLIGLDSGETYEKAGFLVRAVPSAHEALDRDQYGRHLYLGFLIEAEGLRLYHTGDTVVYEGQVEALGTEPFDVFFLPINGRDPARGVPGNMTAAEAVALANACRPRFVVPHHYDMFTFNTVPVREFVDAAGSLVDGVSPVVLRCGERWEVGSWGSR